MTRHFFWPFGHANTNMQGANKHLAFAYELLHPDPNFYIMKAANPTHALACELMLELDESAGPEKEVNCFYPGITNEDVPKAIRENPLLYGTIAITFQAKILSMLFSFCSMHKASNLVISLDKKAPVGSLGVYLDFVGCQKSATVNSAKTTITIPVTQDIINDWFHFTEVVNLQLRQALWHEQNITPIAKELMTALLHIETD